MSGLLVTSIALDFKLTGRLVTGWVYSAAGDSLHLEGYSGWVNSTGRSVFLIAGNANP
jgi:hypothetical protein